MLDLFWLDRCSAYKLNQSYDVRERPKNNINIFLCYATFQDIRSASMTVYQVKSSYKVWFMWLEKDDVDLTGYGKEWIRWKMTNTYEEEIELYNKMGNGFFTQTYF